MNCCTIHAGRQVGLSLLLAALQCVLCQAMDNRSRAALQQAVMAYQQGASPQVLQALSPTYDRWNAQEANEADQWLEDVGMPSTIEMLLESRLQLAGLGRKRIKPAPGHAERLGILKVLSQRLSQRTNRRSEHPALQSPPVMPADFVEYRRFSEDLHYLKLELQDAVTVAELAEQLAMPLRSARAIARLSEPQQQLVRRDYAQQSKQFQRWAKELNAKQLELRVNRIRDAAAVLRLSDDIRERFLAAHAVASDAEATTKELAAIAEQAPGLGASSGAELLDPAAAQAEIAALVVASQKHLGDMPRKAKLLEEGIYWWLRGRYGIGSLKWGRLKPPPTDLLAQITLHMPVAPLTVRNGIVQTDAWQPLYARRVHYMWQQDNRAVRTRISTRSPQEQVTEVHDDVQLQHTRTVRDTCGSLVRVTQISPDYSYRLVLPTLQTSSIIPNQPEDVYRQVGYLEYNEALRRFDELLPLLSAEELKAVEEIVESDPRLEVETNLSRKIGNGGALAEAPQRVNDNFRRRGLPWVMALARLEVAGIAAGLTELPNPFLSAKTTMYELPAYQALVVDAFRVFDLTTPAPQVWEQVRERGATTLLAFHRRQTMTLQLAEATSRLKLNPAQRAAVAAAAAKAMAIKSELDLEVKLRTRTTESAVKGDTVQRKSETADGVNVKVIEK